MRKIATLISSIVLAIFMSINVLAGDDFRGLQWYLDGISTDNTQTSAGINFSEFSLEIIDESDPVVAVIDTGVDYMQEDLTSQMWVNPYLDKLEGIYGYDFADNDTDPYDKDGHGTHVAGIIAAAENEYGIDGVCDAKIMALKVQADSKNYLDPDAIVDAFDYIYRAMKLGVNVKAVNCSWGKTAGTRYDGREYSDVYAEYIDKIGKLGALTIFAAGNDVVDGDSASYVPFCIKSDYMVVVGATDERERPAWFTNYGQQKVDLFAPGTNILSCSPVYKTVVWEHFIYVSRFDEPEYDIHPNDGYSGMQPTAYELFTAGEIGLYSTFDCKTEIVSEAGNSYLEFSLDKADPYTQTGIINDLDEHIGLLYLDVTDMKLDPAYEYELRVDCAYANSGTLDWYERFAPPKFPHSGYNDLRFVTVGDRTYMRLLGLDDSTIDKWMCDDGKARILIDNIMLFRNEAKTTSGVKYAIKEGTSMAAPIVSGAVTLLAMTSPDSSALEVKEALFEGTRKVDALTRFCSTGGILDLSLLKIPSVSYKILVPKKETITKSYSKYKGQKISISTKNEGVGKSSPKIKWKSNNTKYAKVDQLGGVTLKKAGIGHKVGITVTSFNGKKNVTKKCIIYIKK